jgi:hypothetical protein
MIRKARIGQAEDLMLRFADRTGLTGSGAAPRRYLWTDAFAVCNFLALELATGEARHRELALRLVAQVHAVLGRHRPDAPVAGWLSGLDPAAGEARPTAGGLRIGKPLPERARGAPIDERLEWDRDGQYFHYLTRWMHALDQIARATGQRIFNQWARELAAVAHHAFVRDGRMVWKMSVDLSRPLVEAMGHHDPLDGFVTCLQLDATAAAFGAGEREGPDVGVLAADFARMIPRGRLATEDALGLGGLLVDAYRLHQLGGQDELRDELLGAGGDGLRAYVASPERRRAAAHRLAFRELGLAIGLASVDRLARSAAPPRRIGELAPHAGIEAELLRFWLDPAHRDTPAWRAHADIDDVMLATALLPDGYVTIRPLPRAAAA